jgi:cobyrinic acid a,c-diamide synthase
MVLMFSQMFRDTIDAIAGAIKKESGTVAVNYNEAFKFAYQESRELRKYRGCYDVTYAKQIDKRYEVLRTGF